MAKRWPDVPVVLSDHEHGLVLLLQALGIRVESVTERGGKAKFFATSATGARVEIPSGLWLDVDAKRRLTTKIDWSSIRMVFGQDLVARVAARCSAFGYEDNIETTYEIVTDRKWKRWLNVWG